MTDRPTYPPIKYGKRLFFYFLLVVGSIGLVELTSYIGGKVLDKYSTSIDMKRKSDIFHTQKKKIVVQFRNDTNDIFDPEIGWEYRPNYKSQLYNNNSAGMRGMKEYDHSKPSHKTRIAAFGDSFVYGSEVGDEDTWTYILESLLPDTEILNFGIGGYGTDQAFLRYRKRGKDYHPDIVFIGFTPINLVRNVNVYRRFISTSEWMRFKPRFDLTDNDKLVLIPSPINKREDLWRYHDKPELIKEVGALDYFYKPLVYENPFYDYSATVRLFSQAIEVFKRRLSANRRIYDEGLFNENSDAFIVTLEILKAFAAEARQAGSRPIVLMFPNPEAIMGQSTNRIKVYKPLLDALLAEKIEVVDLADAFKEQVTTERHYMPAGHFSAHSNRLIAEFLSHYLQENNYLKSWPANNTEMVK